MVNRLKRKIVSANIIHLRMLTWAIRIIEVKGDRAVIKKLQDWNDVESDVVRIVHGTFLSGHR